MAIVGVFTDIGVIKAREADNNEGFKIHPTTFQVSRTAGVIEPSRTGPNAGLWFTGPISSRIVVDDNTIKFVCTIPAGQIPINTTDTVREIYINGTDEDDNDFLFALGQPSTPLIYDPDGSLTLELELALSNVDLSSAIVFSYTQATELSEHNNDPCAHPDIIKEIGRSGHFTDSGCVPQRYAGQTYDKYVKFDGAFAVGTYFGVTFTATWTGPDGNLISLPFDNVKTTDEVRAIWNAANPDNTVEHNGLGTEVLPVGTLNLAGGSHNVDDRDLVYLDTDGVYKQAIADGSIKSKIAGIAYLSEKLVKTGSYHTVETALIPPGTDIFLDNTVGQEGKFTTFPTTVKVGFVLAQDLIMFGSQGGGSGGGGGGSGTSVGFDAIVSDQAGVNFYPTTQEAVDAVDDGGRILVDKKEFIDTMIDLTGKRIDFHFNGPEAGWSRFQGLAENQKITFSGVPNSGTWRFEWFSQETIDLPFNATALDIQNALNALTGPGLPVTVTGNYAIGFTLQYTTLVDVPEPTFLHPGTNEIQRVTFSNVPDDGTVQFDFDGQLTANLAWNDDALQFETYLEDLPNLDNVQVTGSFASQQFDIEYIGVDGKQPKNQIVVNMTDLEDTPTPTIVNTSTVQEGIFPASNLKIGATPVIITVVTQVNGNPLGPDAAIKVGKDYTRFSGLGKIENFPMGIDLNGKIGVDTEMLFSGVVNPFGNTGLTPVSSYHSEKSFGLASRRDWIVGPSGDHDTLWEAVAAANNGDRIFVTEDQTIYSQQIINKDIEIHFLNGAQIDVTGFVAGDVLSLGTRVKTRYLRMVLADAGGLPVVLADQQLHGSSDVTAPGSPYVPYAQSFPIAANISIDGFDLWLEKYGLPVADLHVDIYTDVAGNPGVLLGSSDAVLASSVPINAGLGGLVSFNFSSPVGVTPGQYWGKLRVSNITTFDVSNRINVWYQNGDVFATGSAKKDALNDNNWATFGTNADLYFQVRGVNVNQFDTLINLFGTKGNHEDLSVEVSGATTIVDNAFRTEIAATAIYVDGVISRGGGAVVNSVLTNDSGYKSHNIIIRDKDGGVIHDVQDRRSPNQETPAGAVNGINDIFTLTEPAISTDTLLVFVDGVLRPKTEWQLITANTQIQFLAGSIPQLGQSVYIQYTPGQYALTPPRHLTVLDNLAEIMRQVKDIDFGANLSVTVLEPGRVRIDAVGGGGSSEPEIEQRTISAPEAAAKQLTLGALPGTPSKVLVFIKNGPNTFYGDDYTVTGAVLDWNGLGLDSLPVVAGDKWTIMYWT